MAILLILTSLLFPLPSIPFVLGYFWRTKRPVVCAIALGAAFGAIAVSLDVESQGDLYRYIATASEYSGRPLDYVVLGRYSDSPVASLFFWITANTVGADSLPFVVGFIVFTSASYIIFDYCARNDFAFRSICIAILAALFSISLFGSVSAVRSSLAMSLGVLALYRDASRGKLNLLTVALYLLPCFIHTVGALVICVRLLSLLFGRKPALAGILSVFALPAVLSVAGLISSNVPLLAGAMDTLTYYDSWTETGWAAEVLSSSFQQMLRFTNSILLLILIITCRSILIQSRIRADRMAKVFTSSVLIGICMTLGIAIFIASDVYLRTAYFFEPLGIMLAIDSHAKSGAHEPGKVLGKTLTRYALVALSSALFLLYLFQMASSCSVSSILCALLFGVIPRAIG